MEDFIAQANDKREKLALNLRRADAFLADLRTR